MFKELVTRMPDIQLDGEVERLRSNFTNGINHMPVRFSPGKPVNADASVSFYASNACPGAGPQTCPFTGATA
ncbi:hypothetical protein D3C76_1816800 [compost metagenome]